MLAEEAQWVGSLVASLPDDAFPLLNLGSGTLAFRTVDQPFIDEIVFMPLQSRDRAVIHADMKLDVGVDIVLDFTDASQRQRLRDAVGVSNTILCCNMLEHLTISPHEAAAHLLDLCPIGGRIIVTVPYRYGYHADPIDNGFRPSPSELAALFQDRAKLLLKDKISGPILGLHHARRAGRLRYLARVAVPFYKPKAWHGQVHRWWRRALVSCVVVQRTQ